ncbi:MAG TPA: N-methyl-L-tryptophan oxidase [Candidatus Acidoferrales bacterium]|nr:N-methyl-L-tryptophan oxidase [Candidatus Acidoferrales bacterium]
MPSQIDVAVLGLGGIGSGAAYWLAKRGARVAAFERFEFGHARGESHDHSRIIRLSYVTPAYVRLAREAYAAWESVERDAGVQLVFKVGGLDVGPRGGAIPLDGYARAMDEAGVPYQRLDARAIRARWPAFTIGDDAEGLFQADGGIVAAERATAAHQRAAMQFGATLRENAPVTGIDVSDGRIEIEAGGERYVARKLVVAAGPWSNPVLAHFGAKLPLEVTKEQAMYFRARDLDAFAFGKFPVWIWMDDPSFYGFPVFGEDGAVKVTQDAGGKAVDPDTRGFEEDPAITQRVTAFLRAVLPGALGPLHRVKTCLYTLTPDRDFVIDTLPGFPNVAVAVGAGHAFKFASAIGRILADLALDGGTASGIADFAADRSILTMEAPPKTYMV